MASKLFRSAVLLLVCLVALGQCWTITTQAPPNTAAIKTKVGNFNATVKQMLTQAFITKAIRAAASEDPTVKNVMVSCYNIPFAGLLCLFTNYDKINTAMESKTFTVDNLIAAANAQCPGYQTYFNAIKTNVAAVQTRYANDTPNIMANFPASWKKLFISATGFVSQWSAATAPSTALTNNYKAVVNQYLAIQGPDRQKVFNNIIPWSKKYIAGAGALSTPLKNALNLLTNCVNQLKIVNGAKLSTPTNKLAKGITTVLPAILKWIMNRTNNKLTVTNAIKSDSTVTAMCNSAYNYASTYAPAILNTAEIQNYLKIAMSGKYTIAL